MSRSLAYAFVLLLVLSAVTHGAVVIPQGLNPGDMYYLAFITRGQRDATSSDIADYDAFVQGQAALNPALTGTDLGVMWRALGSTPSVSALAHLALEEFPIYLLDGSAKVVDGGTDLWDGTALDFPITLDQFGARILPRLWTGTISSGLPGTPFELGGSAASAISAIVTSTGDDWVDQADVVLKTTNANFYAFSEKLTVPGTQNAVPEPASLAIWAAFAGCMVVSGIRRRPARIREKN
jgi:hypothetical protein